MTKELESSLFNDETIVDCKFYFSLERLSTLIHEPSNINEYLATGSYIYISGLICLNKKKYIAKSPSGQLVLTEYAKQHLAECCLQNTTPYSITNSAGNSATAITYTGIKGDSDVVRYQAEKIYNTMKNFPNTFPEALKYLMKIYKVTNEQLAEYTEISPSVISRLRTNESISPKIETIIYICMGLSLEPIISKRLLELGGYNLRPSIKKDIQIELLLNRVNSLSGIECKKILSQL